MAPRAAPSRGDIWIVDLDPTKGHETSGERRALVISVNELNHGPAGLAVVLPITTKDKGIVTHVKVPAGGAGQTKDGFIKCEEVRSISLDRFKGRTGMVDRATLDAVMQRIALLLGL